MVIVSLFSSPLAWVSLGLRCVQMDSCGFLLLHYDVVFVCCFPLSGSLLSYYDVRSALGMRECVVLGSHGSVFLWASFNSEGFFGVCCLICGMFHALFPHPGL